MNINRNFVLYFNKKRNLNIMGNRFYQKIRKKLLFFIALFMFFTPLCKAYNLDVNMWNDFEGKIGNEDIQLSIYLFENGQIKGNYCYKKYENKIQLTGQLTGNKIELTEFINDKPNGYFQGKAFTNKYDSLCGYWTDISKTKHLDLKLSLKSMGGGSFEHRYSDFYGSDKEVENFVKHIKSSIMKNDKDWIANHVKYPLYTTLNNEKAIKIKNKQQLFDHFDQVFHKTFKEKIQTYCPCNLFHNYQGVMLGNGEIWIYQKPNSNENKYDYYIISINN